MAAVFVFCSLAQSALSLNTFRQVCVLFIVAKFSSSRLLFALSLYHLNYFISGPHPFVCRQIHGHATGGLRCQSEERDQAAESAPRQSQRSSQAAPRRVSLQAVSSAAPGHADWRGAFRARPAGRRVRHFQGERLSRRHEAAQLQRGARKPRQLPGPPRDWEHRCLPRPGESLEGQKNGGAHGQRTQNGEITSPLFFSCEFFSFLVLAPSANHFPIVDFSISIVTRPQAYSVYSSVLLSLALPWRVLLNTVPPDVRCKT